jgi:hypothetical protein
MKPLDLGYQKIDMYPNFCMLYYLEMWSQSSAEHMDILIINLELAREGLLSHT